MWTLSPVGSDGWAVQGEIDKWVPVSNDRIVKLVDDSTTAQLQVHIRGAPSERVRFAFFNVHSRTQVNRTCTLSAEVWRLLRPATCFLDWDLPMRRLFFNEILRAQRTWVGARYDQPPRAGLQSRSTFYSGAVQSPGLC
eukprot:COSAG01_NODE_2715_length_7199_cov_15.544507_3_plen_139_part_00